MSTTVSYKGQTLTTVSNDTKTLLTEGKYLEDDLTLTDVSGSGATLVTKNISANGTYNASSDSADGYSQVNVAVPNTYTNADEGKVVSNGTLVTQTSQSITENGTYDTTLKNSVTVNVGGGAGTDWVELTVSLDDTYSDADITNLRAFYNVSEDAFLLCGYVEVDPSGLGAIVCLDISDLEIPYGTYSSSAMWLDDEYYFDDNVQLDIFVDGSLLGSSFAVFSEGQYQTYLIFSFSGLFTMST